MQSTLTGSQGIADELAANQRSISVAEFFEKNKHMLGFDSDARAIITAIKEGVDNALDATEEAGILPSITVEIHEAGDYYCLVMEDNGPGIPKANLPNVFGKLLYGSRFGSMTQSRGQQGIGISAAVLYSQLTSGKPAKIISRPKGRDVAHEVHLTLDTDTNDPKIHSERDIEWEKPHGTRIELEMQANMRARTRLYDYIRSTAVVNPHAELTFIEPEQTEPLVFERVVDELPQKPKEIRPHPHGVELGHVLKMLNKTKSNTLSGFLQNEFTRVGQKSADEILAHFRDAYYGRELAISIEQYDALTKRDEGPEELESLIIESVSRKSAESKEDFAAEVRSRIDDAGAVSYCDIERIVHESAEAVQKGFSVTYGTTVRENVISDLWDALQAATFETVHSVIDEVTTVRKDTDAVETLARVTTTRLEKLGKTEDGQRFRATNAELTKAVAAAAKKTGSSRSETFGDTSQEKIVEALWSQMHTVTTKVPLVRVAADDRDIVSALLVGMKKTKVSRPSTKCLSPITAEKVEAGLRKEYNADFYASTTRDAGVHSGHPFIVEAGLAYGGDIGAEGKVDVLRFANRVPLVYQPGACTITQTIGSIGWRNYKLSQSGGSGLPDGPVVLMVHVASTNVPFTSESKDALASVENIEYEIEQAVREVAREMKKYLKKQKSLQKRKRKENVIADILPKMAAKLAETAETETPTHHGSLARVMNNMYIRRMETDDGTVVRLSNHTRGQKTLTVRVAVDAEPTSTDEDVSIEKNGSGWIVEWRGPVRKNGTEEFSYATAKNATHEFTFEDIEAEKVTLSA
jgi:DNA topoisomerase-6 subunit B